MKRPKSLNTSLNDVKYEQYVNNLHDRLPQLVDPNDVDCQRWPWELVQNAKDTVVKRPNPEDRYVDIVIKYYTDSNGNKKLYFEHNGEQFTNKAITGLIWKFSAEKRNEQTTEDGLTRDKQSTGRFGTGFMTTHALSLTVDVSGSLFNDDPEIMRNVSVDFTLHREGPDDTAYKDGVDLTERELDENMDKRPIVGELLPTRFTYHLNKEASEKAAIIGIDNVRANAAQTMLFCPSVRSIKVIDEVNNLTFKITRQNNDERKNVIKETVFLEEYSDAIKPITRRFLSTEIEEYSEVISSHWKVKDRNLRLHVAVEVDRDNNILPISSTSPAVYCSLPLIGFEIMSLPFYINSNDFEPATERTSLYLKNKRCEYRTNEDTGEDEIFYLQSGVNWSILERSLSLYESIVDYLIEKDYHHRYNLVNGLNDILKGAWNAETKNSLASRFVLPLRNMLISKNLVKTKEGYRSIKSEVKFVECAKEHDLHALYNICKNIYGANLAVEEENENWVSLKWGRFTFDQDFEEKKPESENPAFPTIKYDKIAEFIENAGSLDNLQLILSNDNEPSLNSVVEHNTLIKKQKLEWLNKFYEWLETSKITNLSEKKIVPNRLGEFCSTEQGCDIKNASEISIEIFDFMKQIELDWDKKLLMEGVQHITLAKETKDNIMTAIKDRSKDIRDNVYESNDIKLAELLPILLALPLNDDGRTEEFFNKRVQIISILKVIFATQCEGKSSVTLDLKAETWEDTDKWFMNIVASTLANRKRLDVIANDDTEEIKKAKYCTSKWLSDTLNFMFQKSYLHQEDITSRDDKSDTLALIPNRYGDFCPINALHTQGQIPNELLNDDLNKTGYDVKKELLYEGFILNEKVSITDLSTAYVAAKYNEFFDSECEDNKKDVANYIIHLIPECGDLYEEIRKLYEESTGNSLSSTLIKSSDLIIWEGAKKYIVGVMAHWASQCENISNIGEEIISQDYTMAKDETNAKIGIAWLNRLVTIIHENNIDISNEMKLIPDWYGVLQPNNIMLYNGNILYKYNKVQIILDIKDSQLWSHFNDDSLKDQGDDNIISTIVNPDYVFVDKYQNNTDDKLFHIVDTLIDYCEKHHDTSWRNILRKAIENLLDFFEANSSSMIETKLISYFPKTYNARKSLSYDYIWDTDTKARISKINDNFSPDEIDNLIREKETIKGFLENKDYYNKLEEENTRLRIELEDLKQRRIANIDYGEDELSERKQFEAQLEAQKKLMETFGEYWIFPPNFGTSDTDGKPICSSTVEVTEKTTGKMLRIVIKSYRDKTKPFMFNPSELEYILKFDADLYMYTHIDEELEIVKIPDPKMDLIMHQSYINISFSSENLDIEQHEDRILDFAGILHNFKKLHFNFNHFNIPSKVNIYSKHCGVQPPITEDDY